MTTTRMPYHYNSRTARILKDYDPTGPTLVTLDRDLRELVGAVRYAATKIAIFATCTTHAEIMDAYRNAIDAAQMDAEHDVLTFPVEPEYSESEPESRANLTSN